MAPTETDPLLPQGTSAPEISGHGFSKRQQVKHHARQVEVMDRTEDYEAKEDDQDSNTDAGLPGLRVLIIMFMIVVGFAAIVTLLFPKTFDVPWRSPKSKTSSIEARVNKILSETPLIGQLLVSVPYGPRRADPISRWP